MSEGNPYEAKLKGGGSYIVCYRGVELAAASTLDTAADLCARDAISGYPEMVHDVMFEPLADNGQILGNVVHMDWYRRALAEAIAGNWEDDG